MRFQRPRLGALETTLLSNGRRVFGEIGIGGRDELETARIRSLHRFKTNMDRVWGLFRMKGESSFTTGKGSALAPLEADLKRAAIVLLHATIEDAFRTLQGRRARGWTFSGASDLQRACRSMDVPFSVIEDITPLMAMLAQRRHEIVHYADLDADGQPQPWRIADTWFSLVWLMGAHALYFRAFKASGTLSAAGERLVESYELAFKRSMQLGDKLVESVQKQDRGDWLDAWWADTVNAMQAVRSGNQPPPIC